MRTIVITGGSSGIGKAVVNACRAAGDKTVTIDLKDADIIADLSLPGDRKRAILDVAQLVQGHVDAVIACAGVTNAPAEQIISVNFFGVVEMIEGLRPLLLESASPRAVVVSSEALILASDAETVMACLDGHEPTALAATASAPDLAYQSSKMAVSRWVKRESVTERWAGSGILLNAVAPGVVATPMVQGLLDTKEGMAFLNECTPMRLGGPADPAVLAAFLLFMASEQNGFIVGQTIFCDGGAEATIRPETI